MTRVPLALLGLGLLALRSTQAAGSDAALVSKLLSETGEQAFQLRSDAQMVSYAAVHPNVNWAGRLHQLKEHIRNASRQLAELGEQRVAGSPHQMATIGRLQPLLRELVGNSEAVVQYVEEGPDRLYQHKAQIAVRAKLASALASLIVNFVEYESATAQLQSLSVQPDPPLH
jgi:hypothetical protein